MNVRPTTPDPEGQPTADHESARHRSGAVARMLQMPVATLRVWERRYGVTRPALSPSGQRLYSAEDVKRLGLIKQLTELGHAVGGLATLDMAQLREVASTHAHLLAARQAVPVPEDAAPGIPSEWRVAVIGPVLGKRLRNPGLLRQLCRPLVLLGPYEDPAQAAATLQGLEVDALLIHQARLHPDWLANLKAAAPDLMRMPVAVLFNFASHEVCESLTQAGLALLREPQPDAVLAQWLNRMVAQPSGTSRLTHESGAMPARRWDDAALADFAGLSTTVACECPRHVAEILQQLANFEAYSAECEIRSAADARLHARLRQVAGTCRAHFEVALEQVALHEGLLLPSDIRQTRPDFRDK